MPYLSWREQGGLKRHRLEDSCVLGRDLEACALAFPAQEGLSRRHAEVLPTGQGGWWIRDLGSKNGTCLNGLPLNGVLGNALEDGDELCLGDLCLVFTEGFPGLDGALFAERVGGLFEEVRPEPAQALVLVQGLDLLHRSTETLLQEGTASGMLRSLLNGALALFQGDRGFVMLRRQDGSWQTAHRVGDVVEHTGLSRSVLAYVAREATSVLSNAPLEDPRFGGESLLELHRGALLCAPLVYDGEVQGVVYLDRFGEGRPFSRFDLALFQAFVRQGAVAYRNAQLARQALGQAEVQGELLRLRSLNERLTEHTGQVLAGMESCLRWILSYAERAQGDHAEGLRHQVQRLQHLVASGFQESRLEVHLEPAGAATLEAFQRQLEGPWQSLVRIRGAVLAMSEPLQGSIWVAGNLASQAVMGLVEPMFLGLASGQEVQGEWADEAGTWVLRLTFPAGLHGPAPDTWTSDGLAKSGILWRWSEQVLSLVFHRGLEAALEQPPLPLLGLVTEELELMGLFQSVAEAGQLGLFPLEETPPMPPLPAFRYLVVDAGGVEDAIACIEAYRHHPAFATVPILVVRAPEDLAPALVAAGATDWLPTGFRWETLHHRLQVLKGHDELQRKALAAERLDTFKKMAGTLKHEINNPLAIISMQVELLERKYPEEPKLAKIGEMVERIRGLVQVLQKMREMPVEGYADGSSILKIS